MDPFEGPWAAAQRGRRLSRGSAALLTPRRLGTRKETGLVGAEAAKEFPNRKTRGCGPQDKAGRSRGSWAVSHRVCSRQHAVKCPGQSTGKGWEAGGSAAGTERPSLGSPAAGFCSVGVC